MAIRSLLYTPGNDPRKVAKVGTFGADGVVLDLEDAVAIDEKVAARKSVREAIPSVRAAAGLVYVRINPIGRKSDFSMDIGAGDIEAVICDELVVPKVESPDELVELDQLIDELEAKQDRLLGSVEIAPLIETALGLWNAYEIARSSARIRSLHFGAGDFTRDAGMDWSRDEAELTYARARLVVISRAAGIGPPMDSVWIRLRDDEGLANSVAQAKRMGFQGKCCIHPSQVGIVNRGFSYVSEEELSQAKKVVDAFAEAQSRGSASIQVDGQFVDYPIVERAKQILALQGRTSESEDQ